VWVIILQRKEIKQYVITVGLCRLNYSVRNNHVTCYITISHLSSDLKLYTFPYHMYQFQKMVLNINCGFLAEYVPKILHILEITQWDIIINVHRSSFKYTLFLTDFYNFWILSGYIGKLLKNFHVNPSGLRKFVSRRKQTDGRTDRRT